MPASAWFAVCQFKLLYHVLLDVAQTLPQMLHQVTVYHAYGNQHAVPTGNGIRDN